jgi:hypothetical protein
MDKQRAALEWLQQTGSWLNNRIPDIMTAAEAYEMQGVGRRFYTIAWWGDGETPMPAGFTRFDFEAVLGREYVIMWRDEPRDRVGAIPADEWVLMFSD